YADAEYVAGLHQFGSKRVSLGVQDFDLEVQRAVDRVQNETRTRDALAAARENGFRSVNIDLIYGLPKQTLLSFEHTLERVIAADPDRIAVYNYAHLPTVFKPQRRMYKSVLPSPETRLKLLALAIRWLTTAGYQYIGMDHFAKIDDSMAVAQRQG